MAILKHPLASVIAAPPSAGPFGPLTTLEIPYWDFGDQDQTGYLTVHPDIAEPIRIGFAILKAQRFPIFSMLPAPFEADGDTSLDTPELTYEANGVHVRIPRQFVIYNTVGFVDKIRTGKTSPSHHAFGMAFDLNPHCNPLVRIGANGNETYRPNHARYSTSQPGTITLGIAKIFKDLGFNWGGDWVEHKDYMHFSWGGCEEIFPELKPERPGADFTFT